MLNWVRDWEYFWISIVKGWSETPPPPRPEPTLHVGFPRKLNDHSWLFIAFHQKTQAELESLDQEHTKLQQKHDAAKARNKVLASELKGLKAQVQTLLEKGAHDDELIAALMVMLTDLE